MKNKERTMEEVKLKPHEITTVMKIDVKDRDRLKKISHETGRHMKFILGKLIKSEYDKTFPQSS